MWQNPFNVETQVEYAVIVSTNDDPNNNGLGQRRVQIQPASLSSVTNTQSLPWMKVYSHHSQESSQQGGTIKSPHSYLPGNKILVRRATASGQDYEAVGNPGTISDFSMISSGVTSPDNYKWSADPAFGTSGKKTHDTTQVPTNVSYNNPTSPSFQSQFPHIRAKAFSLLKNSQFSQNAQRLFQQAQHIGPAGPDLNQITKLIQQFDPQGMAEATQNLNTVKMLDQMRTQMNQIPSLGSFTGNANQGIMTGLQSMIGSQGMQFFTQLIQMATQIGSNMNNHNASANTQNTPLTTSFSVDPITGEIIVSGPLAPIPDASVTTS